MRANGFESNLSEEALAPVERWITDDELKDIYSSSYWNDIEDEKRKNGGSQMVIMLAVPII